jgi:hypothetical protein
MRESKIEDMNENTNLAPVPSALNNVLSGIGIFILGILLDFFLFGPGLMGDAPGVSLLKRAMSITLTVIIGYGIIGYFLGKIKPNLSWKSGMILATPSIIMPIFGLVWLIRDFLSSPQMNPENLFLILPFVATLIVAPLCSYFGSRSKKTWQGKFPATILKIVLIITALIVGYYIIGVVISLSRGPTITPALPSIGDKSLSP